MSLHGSGQGEPSRWLWGNPGSEKGGVLLVIAYLILSLGDIEWVVGAKNRGPGSR